MGASVRWWGAVQRAPAVNTPSVHVATGWGSATSTPFTEEPRGGG